MKSVIAVSDAPRRPIMSVRRPYSGVCGSVNTPLTNVKVNSRGCASADAYEGCGREQVRGSEPASLITDTAEHQSARSLKKAKVKGS